MLNIPNKGVVCTVWSVIHNKLVEIKHKLHFLQLNGMMVDQPLSSQDHVIGQLKEHIANQAMCLLATW